MDPIQQDARPARDPKSQWLAWQTRALAAERELRLMDTRARLLHDRAVKVEKALQALHACHLTVLEAVMNADTLPRGHK